MGVLVSCVAENGERWYREVENLVLSVRHLGGPLADAPVVVHFVERVEPQYVDGLAALGAEVRVVDRVEPRNPPSNKLRMLELAQLREFDLLLMIDTDTVLLGDVTAYAVPDAISVKPENTDPLPRATWQQLFAALGIAEPARTTTMTSSGQRSYPYYNSGVLVVPHALCAPLLERWRSRVADVLDLYERRPDVVPAGQRHWTNQLALALALADGTLSVHPLPVAANLSTTVRVHRSLAPTVRPPWVLHYHNEMDADGFLLRSRNRHLNRHLDEMNRVRARTTGTPYDGLPRPPLVRRALRRLEGHGWYEHGPLARVRRHRLLAPVRRQAKRLASGGAR